VGTTAFGGGGFTVWGCFSLICKIDLYVIDGTLRGQKYRDQILRSLVVPHFDGHPFKNDFNPTSALSSMSWYSIPYGHVPIEAWQFCGVFSVADVLSVS
jgi:hypothetical protein